MLLKLWHTYNPDETVTLNGLLEGLRRKHPEWQIEVTVIPFARAQNEYRRAVRECGPGAPDVFRAELPWLAEFVSRKLVRPVPRDAPAESLYLDEANRAARYLGQRWALPTSLDCLALLFNRRFISRPPRTMEEFVVQARRLTTDSRGRSAGSLGFDATQIVRWGFYVRADAYWFLPFLWAQGGDLLDPETRRVFIDQPAAVSALERYRDLIRVERVAPPRPSPSNDYEDQMRRFAAGEVAMIFNGPWAVSTLLAHPAFKGGSNLGVAPIPRGGHGAKTSPLSGHGLVVSSCAGQPAEAWRLAAALSDLDAQVRFAQERSVLPALRAAYERPQVMSNSLVARFREALASAHPRPQHPAIALIFDDFNPAVQAVLLGDASPAEALSGVARSWRRILDLPAGSGR